MESPDYAIADADSDGVSPAEGEFVPRDLQEAAGQGLPPDHRGRVPLPTARFQCWLPAPQSFLGWLPRTSPFRPPAFLSTPHKLAVAQDIMLATTSPARSHSAPNSCRFRPLQIVPAPH
jgi:hypothetical protein